MIIIMLALAKNGVIGKTGEKLPWNIPDELKLFRSTTKNNVVIMGRKTWDSIGRPLPNRVHIVVSRSMKPVDGVTVCNSVEAAIEEGKKHQGMDIFIVGGAEIVRQSFHLADKMYLSHLKKAYDGDTYFPKFNENDWLVEKRVDYPEFEFVVYARNAGQD